jgi:multiple antibiotic resistance protein
MDLLKPLVALLAIVNPVGVLPFFIHFTQGFTREQRQRTIRISAVAAGLVVALSALAGNKIIGFFGISIASFMVGGGTLLLISALQMLNAKPAEAKPTDVSDAQQKADAGATMVIYAERTRHWWEQAVLVGYGLVVALVTFAVFTLSGKLARLIGQTGINVMTRLMGLILAALAVEIMSDGLVQLFPILASKSLR